eukprot:TRINITY_DN65449_c0_g1_i1.p1 TRINITY_DN65449_c0_g1~~TRINITY_DN65449_c0_g1_i1.p1  ORF type:complete len:951 (-),score=180.77 TRINITY_DN65449_c0_g1_i1:64-2916(-)
MQTYTVRAQALPQAQMQPQMLSVRQLPSQVPAGIQTAGVAYSQPVTATAIAMAGYPSPQQPSLRVTVPAVPGRPGGVRSWVPPPQAAYPQQPLQTNPQQHAPGHQPSLLGTVSSVPRGAPPTTYGTAVPTSNNLLRTMQHTGSYQPPPITEAVPIPGTAPAPCPTTQKRPVAVPVEVVSVGQPQRGYVPPYTPNRVVTVVGIEHLQPAVVRQHLGEDESVIVDLRGDDRSAGTIEGTRHIPAPEFLQRLVELTAEWADKKLVCFMCQYSAHRAPHCANLYKEKANPHQRVAILENGFRGWEAAGLPCRSLAEEQAAKEADDVALRIGNDFVVQQIGRQHGGSGSHVPKVEERVQPRPGMMFVPGSNGSLRQVPSFVPGITQSPARTSSNLPPHAGVYVPPETPNRVPTVAGVEHLDPRVVQDLLSTSRNQCLLVDLRGEDRAAGLIDGAIHVPAIDKVPFTTKIPQLVREWANMALVIFTCQYSAHRAPQCANWYRAQTYPQQRVAILSGGFRGWESLGLPVQSALTGEAAQQMDRTAMQLGTHFVKQAAESPHTAPAVSPTAAPPAAVSMPVAQPQSQVSQEMPPQPQGAQAQAAKPKYVPPHLPQTVPTIKDVEHLEPVNVQELLGTKGCILVDLRGEDRAAGLIEGAVHEPAIDKMPFTMKVPKLVEKWKGSPLVIFTCQYSAHRAPQCANWYRQAADKNQRVAILKGGFRGWEANGLPVQSLAEGEAAKKADEMAVKLGTNFVDGCLAGIPGGGFCMPGATYPSQTASTQGTSLGSRAASTAAENALPQIPNAVPVVEDVENMDPAQVHELMKNRKCLLVDLRGDDRASGLIEGATHEPAIGSVPFPTRVPNLVQQWADQSLVVFTCQYSAHRAPQCANWYRQVASPQQRVGILKGGFRGWEAQGLPVQSPLVADQHLQAAADQVALNAGAKIATVAGGFGGPCPA